MQSPKPLYIIGLSGKPYDCNFVLKTTNGYATNYAINPAVDPNINKYIELGSYLYFFKNILFCKWKRAKSTEE